MNGTITLTFSESVENHVGMEIIGKKSSKGYHCGELYDLSINEEEANIVVFRE
jgi:hypothetical protein